jgi:hypothetical protein
MGNMSVFIAMSSLSTLKILPTIELMGVKVCVGKQFNREANTNTVRLTQLRYIKHTARVPLCTVQVIIQGQAIMASRSDRLP